jgi:hypothetical protein
MPKKAQLSTMLCLALRCYAALPRKNSSARGKNFRVVSKFGINDESIV